MPKPPKPQLPQMTSAQFARSAQALGSQFVGHTFTQQYLHPFTTPPEYQMKDQEWRFTQQMLFPLGQWLVSNRGIASKELEQVTLHVDEILRAHARCERARQDLDVAVSGMIQAVPNGSHLTNVRARWEAFIVKTRMALKLRLNWRSYELLRLSPLMIVVPPRRTSDLTAVFVERASLTYLTGDTIIHHFHPQLILREYNVVRQQPIQPSPINGEDRAPSFCHMEVLWDKYLEYFKAPFSYKKAHAFWMYTEAYPGNAVLYQPPE